jgi:hypothetical protein
MFDERHLQLSSAYAKSSEYFARTVIAPYIKHVLDSIELVIDDEINKRLKLEIGKETYVMSPDENGGYKWEKFDPETKEFIQAEFTEQEEFEELLTKLLTSSREYLLLPASDIPPLLPGSNTPPAFPPSDSPPVLPPDDRPPFLPPSATPVELVFIPVEITPLYDSIKETEGHSSIRAEKEVQQEEKLPEEFPSEQTSPDGDTTRMEEEELPIIPPTSTASPDSPPPPNTLHIDPNHSQELVEDSAIAPDVASLNFEEQKGDGTVNTPNTPSTSPENLEEEQTIPIFGKNRNKLSTREPTSLIAFSENSSLSPASRVIDAEVLTEGKKEIAVVQGAPPLAEAEDYEDGSWARREQVTVYQQNFFRKRLSARENKEIASTALALLKNYGVEKDDNLVYRADAFTIKKEGNNYSIHRRSDETKAIMQFQADKWGTITSFEQPKEMMPIERQEFLLVADYLKSKKQLPSVDEDPRKIASTLGSLSVDGTHKILESFKTSEVLQILTQTIKKTGRDDLELGNYRILYEKSQQDSTSVLKLLKTEHTGITRVAASFELNRTDEGMTHQVKTLALSELDLNKLRLLAQKLHIPPNTAASATVNPYATRDIELPLHPKLAKQWQDLENRQQPQNSVSYKAGTKKQDVSPFASTPDLDNKSQNIEQQPVNTTVERPIKKTSISKNQHIKPNAESIPLPLHPLLAQYWQELEDTNRWTDNAKQGNSEFREKIQSSGKLTIGEQRELYYKIQVQAQTEIRQQQITSIVLPPLSEITHDLRLELNQLPHSQNQADSSSSIRNTPLPLHPEIAKPWQDLETTGKWAGVANQGNYPLRDKLKQTGKLTLGEQRELYSKILIQSEVDLRRQGITDISLPPLNEILQDLMSARSTAIDSTYSPKVEVRSQKSQQHHNSKTPSTEVEL